MCRHFEIFQNFIVDMKFPSMERWSFLEKLQRHRLTLRFGNLFTCRIKCIHTHSQIHKDVRVKVHLMDSFKWFFDGPVFDQQTFSSFPFYYRFSLGMSFFRCTFSQVNCCCQRALYILLHWTSKISRWHFFY